MPSGGDPAYTEALQARFLAHLLDQSTIRFALFEAFDRVGWEHISPVEPYWGIYRHNRELKPAADTLRRRFLRDASASRRVTRMRR